MHRLVSIPLLLAACSADPAPAFLDESHPLPPGLARPGRKPTYHGAPTRIFLELDGAEIQKGSGSDAQANLSYLCGGTFPAWDHTRFAADRAQAKGELRAAVQALFADFNVLVLTERPALAPYDLLVVGGTATLCGKPDGLGGLGPLDCGNLILSDVAFVFGATIISLEGLAVAIAHEAAHSWGLPHTTEPCDVMSSSWCTGGHKGFVDREMAVPPDPSGSCGLQTSNSWQRLRDLLGAAPSPAADARPAVDTGRGLDAGRAFEAAGDRATPGPSSDPGGCSTITRRVSPAGPSLVIWSSLILLALLLRRRGDSTWAFSTRSRRQRVTRARTRSW